MINKRFAIFTGLFCGLFCLSGASIASAQDSVHSYSDSASVGNHQALIAFDGFDDDEGGSSAVEDAPASDEPSGDEMSDGTTSPDVGTAHDPDADPGYTAGFDPDKE